MRVCWNRQTGKLEVLVFDWTCGFKSHHSHHFPLSSVGKGRAGSSPAIRTIFLKIKYARVVELADSLDSGSSVHYGRAGSSPASRTKSDTNFDTMGIRLVSVFFCAMGRPVLHESAQRVFACCALAQRTGSLIPFF